MTDALDTTHEPDWQDRIIAEAATVTVGPLATSEPVRLERLPEFVNLEGFIDVSDAEYRFKLAREGRAFLPALAEWKRRVVVSLDYGDEQSSGHAFGDEIAMMFFAFSGVTALADVLLEIGSIGGDNDSTKEGPDAEMLDAYAAELGTGAEMVESVAARLDVEPLDLAVEYVTKFGGVVTFPEPE